MFLARLTKKISLIDGLTVAAFIFAPPYLYAMVFYPYIESGFDWNYLQAVWENWQTVNAGVLAFLASIVAITLAQMNARNRDAQNLSASLGFLASSLHEISSFCSKCAVVYNYVRTDTSMFGALSLPDLPIPTAHRETFRECIKYSDRSIRVTLSSILSDLQILRANMDSNRVFTNDALGLARQKARNELAMLVILEAKILALYPVARNEVQTVKIPIDGKFITDSIMTLNIEPDSAIISKIKTISAKDNLFLPYQLPD